MSLEKIHLRKLIQLFFLPENRLVSELRQIIRSDLQKEQEQKNGGGDFYVPFWADAKSHMEGDLYLPTATDERMAKNKQRFRLYPVLCSGFLSWWNEKRRWSNQPFELYEQNPNGRYIFEDINLTVKVENTVAFKIGDGSDRVIYPYFVEEPALNKEAARLALWLMTVALPEYNANDMRILDVQRGASYSVQDVDLSGDEEAQFRKLYKKIFKRWLELKKEY